MKITADIKKRTPLRIKDIEVGKVYKLACTTDKKPSFVIRLNNYDVIVIHDNEGEYAQNGYCHKNWKDDNSEIHEFDGSFTVSNNT